MDEIDIVESNLKKPLPSIERINSNKLMSHKAIYRNRKSGDLFAIETDEKGLSSPPAFSASQIGNRHSAISNYLICVIYSAHIRKPMSFGILWSKMNLAIKLA